MKAVNVPLLSLSLVVILSAGCNSSSPSAKTEDFQQEEEIEAATHTVQLTSSQVVQIADRFAGERPEFDVAYYPGREPKYDESRKTWSVPYRRVPNRRPGDHFMITVNDKTGEAKLIKGR